MGPRAVWVCGFLLLAVAASAEEGYGPLIRSGLDEQLAIGADLFFSETFDGNGRTCGTCHLATENFTLPADLSGFDEDSPLMVGDYDNPNHVADLELCDPVSDDGNLNCQAIAQNGLILVNADGNLPGWDGVSPSYVMRSVPHTLSLSLTIEPLQAVPVTHLTGWAGDGAPGNGSLNEFAEGAVTQHFTKHIDRDPPDDFRLPTQAELNAMEAFQLALGRTEQVPLNSVSFLDQNASAGQTLFTENRRCQICHAAADLLPADRNALLDNGVEKRRKQSCTGPQGPGVCPQQSAGLVAGANFDGGFGTDDLQDTRWGNKKFDPPPLIEAADTAPFFHDNGRTTLEAAINHYRDATLDPVSCPSIQDQLNAGIPEENLIICGLLENPGVDAERQLGSMLRILNAGLNLSMATQRLNWAKELLAAQAGDPTVVEILLLAREEIEDAETVVGDVQFNSIDVFADTGGHISAARSGLAAAVTGVATMISGGATETALEALIDDLVAVSEDHLSDDFFDETSGCSAAAYADCRWIFGPAEGNKLFDNAGVTASIVDPQTEITWSWNPDTTVTLNVRWRTAEWTNPLFDKTTVSSASPGAAFAANVATTTTYLGNGLYERTGSYVVPCSPAATYRLDAKARVGGVTDTGVDTVKGPKICPSM